MRWLDPHAWGVLFSARHGLFLWHPAVLFAVLGLIPLWRAHRLLTVAVAILFAAEVYVNASALDWWGGDGFGGRRFIGMLPWLAMPLAALLSATRTRRAWHRGLLTLLLLLTLWNGLSFAQYRLGWISRADAPTVTQLTAGRVTLPFEIAARLLAHRSRAAGAGVPTP